MHAERRRVDQQAGVGEQFRQALRADAPKCRRRNDRASSWARSSVRLTMRMSPMPRCCSAWMTARAAPPAPSTTAALGRFPARRVLVEIGGKAVGVGVAAAELAVLEPERVDRADQLGRLVARGDAGEGGFLVRDRDIAAGKARSRQVGQEARESRPARRRSPRSCRQCRSSSASGHGSAASANARSDGRRRRPSIGRSAIDRSQLAQLRPAAAAAAGRRW